MKFTVEITAPDSLAGITAARTASDAGPFETNQEYIQFVMERAAESYAQQYILTEPAEA